MTSLQDVKAALKEPITDAAVLRNHLSTVIQQIHPSSSTSSGGQSTFEKNIAAIQGTLLENVLPAWSGVVEEDEDVSCLVEECFAPEGSSGGGSDSRRGGKGARRHPRRELATAYSGYHTLSNALSSSTTSPHLFPVIINLTSTLTTRYSLSDLWNHAFEASSSGDERGGSFIWEQSVKMAVALPARVMNAYGRVREAGVRGVEGEVVDRLNGRYVWCLERCARLIVWAGYILVES